LSLEEIIEGYRYLSNMNTPSKSLLYESLKNPENRAKTFGITSILNTSIPLAVKTGTSSNFRDNWTVGYNHDYIIGIWVGNANHEMMDDVSGISGAGPIYKGITETMIKRGYIDRTLNEIIPPGLELQYLCLNTSCTQKLSQITKKGFSRKSRPASKIYFSSDFFGSLSPEEKERWNID
jgi:membrane carboxypeptidase/penicillin-binding protein PbpC